MGVATQHNVNLDIGLNVLKTTIMGNTSVLYTIDKDDIQDVVGWFNQHQKTSDKPLNQEQQQLKYDLGCNMIYFMHKDKRQVSGHRCVTIFLNNSWFFLPQFLDKLRFCIA